MRTMVQLTMIFVMTLCMSVDVQAQSVASFHDQPVECLGVELDGSQTLRSMGSGNTKFDAVEQAKKNAVWAVIFNGIRQGKAGCDMRPLLNEVNAKEKYEEYFNIFFADGGEYKKYVSMEDQKRRSKDKSKNKYYKNYTITVRVLRSELKARLKQDNVLK